MSLRTCIFVTRRSILTFVKGHRFSWCDITRKKTNLPRSDSSSCALFKHTIQVVFVFLFVLATLKVYRFCFVKEISIVFAFFAGE